ncbi:uncharacterized protein [Amphiura filiformis]|uniref:uncharacterized protein n=1 Tax=Amphiura filiformis TaxID=82378 RepID=UPI003B2201A2
MNKMVGFTVFCIMSVIGASLTVKEEGLNLHWNFEFSRVCFDPDVPSDIYDYDNERCKDYYFSIADIVIGSVAFVLSIAGSIIACQKTCSCNETFNEEDIDRSQYTYLHNQRQLQCQSNQRMQGTRHIEHRDLQQPSPYHCNQFNQSSLADQDNVQNQQPPPYSYNMRSQDTNM